MLSRLILNNGSLVRKCLDLIGFILQIIPVTALALFCCLARLLSLHLGAIRIRVIEQQSISFYPSSTELLEPQRLQLKVLQRQHLLICKTIGKINHYFGIFMVIEVLFIFVGVTNDAMFLLMGVIGAEGLLEAVNGAVFVSQVVHLFLLTTFSDEIAREV